jgi:hypothetical protein
LPDPGFGGFAFPSAQALHFPPAPRAARDRAEKRRPTRRRMPPGCATPAVIASWALRDTFWGHPEMEGILRAQIAHSPRHTPTCQQNEHLARKTRCPGYFCEALPGVGPVGRQGGRRCGIPSEGIREAFFRFRGVRRRFSAQMRRKISAQETLAY